MICNLQKLFVLINFRALLIFWLFIFALENLTKFLHLLHFHGILLYFSLLEFITFHFIYYQGHFALNFCLQGPSKQTAK